MKDIFIDNCIAKDFATPINDNYKSLIKWLFQFDAENIEDNAYLVLSQKLLNEYIDSSQNCSKSSAIPVIISKLTKEGRINRFSNNDIKVFKRLHFKPKVVKRLRSSIKDRDHIPIVMMSERKLALTIDENFAYDLVNFPKFVTVVSDCPSKIDYK